MATVALVPDVITDAGVAANYNGGLSTSNTYTFRNNSRTLLHVKNGGGSPCTVTINSPASVRGHGPFAHDVYDDVNHDVSVALSFITSVTVAVLQLP